MRRILKIGGGILLVALVGAQFVRPARDNPPVDAGSTLEATAQVPAPVGDLLRRACYDCHSNQTRWPWYSEVAPVSWLVARDVRLGRGQLNFSAWGEYNAYDRADLLDEACEETTEGNMPLGIYTMMHSRARLSPADVAALCAWTSAEAARLVAP